MSDRDEVIRFLPLATSVSDGRTVDWTAIRSGEPEPDARALIDELEIVYGIMAAGRPGPPSALGGWGHLLLIGMIGQGAVGAVYRAWDPRLQSEVALKLLTASRERAGSGGAIEEARLLARVRHPHIVTVHGAACLDGVTGIWMELIRGQTLEEVITSHGPLSSREASLVGIDLCGALAAIHAVGLLHRDIKTQNVLREHGGRIVLMDFSSARETPGPSQERTTDISGTPMYMAPEILAGTEASVRSDVYSLGVVLYRLVTGRYPVAASSLEELKKAHEERRFIPLRQIRPDVPQSFAAVVEKAMAVDCAARFESVSRLEQELAATLGHYHRVKAESLARPSGRARWGATGLAVACAAILLIAIALPAIWHPGALAGPPYTVRASMQRIVGAAAQPLPSGSAVAPGDRLSLEFESSTALHVYIVNEDERGESYLLFPLPGLKPENPLLPGHVHRLPGTLAGSPTYWGISSAGGREHFLIVASPERLLDLETDLAAFARPRAGDPWPLARLTGDAGERLRGAGILLTDPVLPAGALHPTRLNRLAASLSGGAETTSGVWLRRIDLENPGP